MAGRIGCDGLGVAGGQDNTIRISQSEILQTVDFPDPEAIVSTITQSVSIIVS